MTPDNNNIKDLHKLAYDHRERLKELACINQTASLIKEGKSVEETLQKLCLILPPAWQYPQFTCCRIRFDGKMYTSSGFIQTKWIQRGGFENLEGQAGNIEIYYTQEFVESDEGPFLSEERDLLNNICNMLTGYLNSIAAKRLLVKPVDVNKAHFDKIPDKIDKKPNRKLLHTFLNKNNYDRDIYHDLMPYKVKEILLVANLYDAYSIEKEGRFSEHVLGEYAQLNLTSAPRITGVSSEDEIFEQINSKHFDLIIFMIGVDKKTPLLLANKIKKEASYIPIYFLLNNNADISYFQKAGSIDVDRLFVWNGDSMVFFAMIKALEDKINVENDTRIGLVRVILLVEDSPSYYSRYMPMLFSIVMEQTKRIIDDVTTDELYKILKLRARPKILLASDFEEAISIVDKYKEFMLCLISDMKFKKDGEELATAGTELVKYIRDTLPELPVIIQSSESENAEIAFELKCTFIDKNSESLVQDFRSFIMHYLGFGNFIYRDKQGMQIGIARTLKEFEKQLSVIPEESLIYHAKRNHFSLWLMARGEIQVAKIINPARVSDFKDSSELREYLITVIQKFRNEQNKGKVIPFEESAITDETNIVTLSDGALGGKGRGLAFVNTLIHNFDFSQLVPGIHIRTPKTSIVGVEEFQFFMERNQLHEKVMEILDYQEIRNVFNEAKLSESLIKKLRLLLKHIKKPLAVRSSGLFEDSLMQPFAGIFETYILPNNHPEFNVRLEQCMTGIKMVYASVFSKIARGYIEAINYKLEEEKMAVVIQELVGNQYEQYYYPHMSGVAQSYNYYPFGHIQPEDGFAVAALGLGTYVVQGEKAYRFCPRYPNLEINSPKDQFKNSQTYFYAVNLENKDVNLMEGEDAGLIKLDIEESEKHGSLKHLASVFDYDNERIVPGLDTPGPRIINFANILKYQYIPFAETLEAVLDVVKEALGTPVEIEFAIDLSKDDKGKASFYLLQIKPLIGSAQDYNIEVDEMKPEDFILFTEKGMGNGIIHDLQDIIYIDRDAFDKSCTVEMAEEIEKINTEMIKANRKYVLIGPGRWGTRDRWIGIPVAWPQISNAKVIVETSFEDFPLDASSGSHFFHNVTSMNIGYFSVQQELGNNRIEWEKLDKQELIGRTTYFKHIRFNKAFKVMMDGKKRIALITL